MPEPSAPEKQYNANGRDSVTLAESEKAPSRIAESSDDTTVQVSTVQPVNNDNDPASDPLVVDWDGPDDPENPRNWPARKKVTIVGIVAVASLVSPLASSMVAPGVKLLMDDFGNDSPLLSSFTVSSYVLGFAFGPLFLAPLSELYGRSPVYICAWICSLCFTIGCAKAPSLAAFIVFRVLAGMSGVVSLANGGGTIVDVYDVHQRGLAMSIFAMGPLMGPVIGPVGGGFLSQAKGWRWVFWFLAILFGFTSTVSILFLKETYAPILLERKTKRLIQETGNTELHSKFGSKKSPKTLFWTAIRRPLTMLATDPIVTILALYIAVVFAYLYLLFTTFPTIFAEQYHFSRGTQGLAYIGLGVGCLLGSFFTALTSDRVLQRLTKKHGKTKPEFRLVSVMITCWAVPGGLFWYGWAADKRVHWIVPILGTTLFGFGLFGTMMPVQTYLIDSYKLYAASALAATTLLRSLIGALLPLGGLNLYKKLGIGWGNSLLAFIALAMLPFPFLFYRFGERIRVKFRREY
ncbi:MFS general substrate transporter [Lepidopterella palustris CBS 459.81]|uniref:MFS general substrate transporter n=1 Tax=Lepidopterella palustris CBS 459.81 TaxID=1314670 RepID=A0A8E2EEX9_9PEZI|nr:MFS general substrate transporter [Lepidopterella palustris CBS 459.81]